jgi:hypothetical protein
MLDRYNLAVDKIKDIDLRMCFMQQRPNDPMDDILTNYLMIHSPHYEIAKMYFDFGEKHLKRHFKSTTYYQMCKRFLKKNVHIPKNVSICNAMKEGYLSGNHKNDHVIVLLEPFAKTRYSRDVPIYVPEVWSGHHRIGALIALEQYVVPVAIAKDMKPGSRFSEGKIHKLCVEEKWT